MNKTKYSKKKIGYLLRYVELYYSKGWMGGAKMTGGILCARGL